MLRRALLRAAAASPSVLAPAARPCLSAPPFAFAPPCAPFATRAQARALDSLRRRRELAAAERTGARPPPPLAAGAAGAWPSPPPPAAPPLAATDGVAAPAARSTLPPLAHATLVVTREIEWANVLIGFEQANAYLLRTPEGLVAGHLVEETASAGSAVVRQLARGRRPFTASLLGPDGGGPGDALLRVRRPFVWLASRLSVEDGPSGAPVAEVHQRWHPWRRQYDLFVGRAQVGRVRSGLFAWEFVVEDEGGRPLARVDRDFSGLAKELFTDAGAYVVRFGGGELSEREGSGAGRLAAGDAGGAEAGEGVQPLLPPPPPAAATQPLVAGAGAPAAAAAAAAGPPAPGPASGGGGGGGALQPAEAPLAPLGFAGRAAVLALAVAIDFDFFSSHSSALGGGGFMPVPIFFPGGGGGGSEAAAAEPPAAAAGDEAPAGAEPAGAAPRGDDWRAREELDSGEAFKEQWPSAPEEEAGGGDDGGGDGGDDDDGGDGGASGWGMLRGLLGQDDDDE